MKLNRCLMQIMQLNDQLSPAVKQHVGEVVRAALQRKNAAAAGQHALAAAAQPPLLQQAEEEQYLHGAVGNSSSSCSQCYLFSSPYL